MAKKKKQEQSKKPAQRGLFDHLEAAESQPFPGTKVSIKYTPPPPPAAPKPKINAPKVQPKPAPTPELEPMLCGESADCLDNDAQPGEQCPNCGGIVPALCSEQQISKNIGNIFKEAQNLPVKPTQTETTVSSFLQEGVRALFQGPKDDNGPHVMIVARAGTGKTTTLIEGLKMLKGLPPKITPSEQQAKIWEQMASSRGARSICFAAYNNSIANELKTRVPDGVDARTLHSLGYTACRKAFQGIQLNQYRVKNLIETEVGGNLRSVPPEIPKAVQQLVSRVKSSLEEPTEEALYLMAMNYEVELGRYESRIFDLVPKVLDRCLHPEVDGEMDFDDMVWLPIARNLQIWKHDLLLVDEAQDMDRCRQEIAKRCGHRIIFCGDPQQAIYAFAGADAQSMSRLGDFLKDTQRGCVTLPLNVTRRCGKAIVQEALHYVSDFHYHESNPEGRVTNHRFPWRRTSEGTREELPLEKTYLPHVAVGDMILCRSNAPLISQCFKLLAMGVTARIQGKDSIGAGLIGLITQLSPMDVPDLITRVDHWLGKETKKEMAKKNPSENLIAALGEKRNCIISLCESAKGGASLKDGTDHDYAYEVEDLIRFIESIFTDEAGVSKQAVRLSSIHKAKGLEARRVFILEPEEARPRRVNKTPWGADQERNLKYVAITRAIEELVYVS